MKWIICIFFLVGCGESKAEVQNKLETRSGGSRGAARAESEEPLFSKVVEDAAIENGLPASLLFGLFWHESRFREDATKSELHLCRKNHWSPELCKSYGLGQVVLGYHRADCGLTSERDLGDMRKSVSCTAKFLGGCLKAEKGNIRRALKRFNGPKGHGYEEKVLAAARMFGSPL